MRKTPIAVVLIWALVLQMVCLSGNLPQARADQNSNTTPSLENVHMAVASSLVDPMLASIDNDPNVNLELDLSSRDPSVDQDPFFLRSQNWVSGNPSGDDEDLETFSTPTDVTVTLPGLKKSWHLNLPVHGIYQNDDYLFFAANNGASIFSSGQGLFFVRTNELIAASVKGERVPILFMPMPGNDWQATDKTDVIAKEIPGSILFFTTSGLPLPVSKGDLNNLAKAENLNLFLATSQALNKTLDAISQHSDQLNDVRARFVQSFQALNQKTASNTVGDGDVNLAQNSYTALVDRITELVGAKNLVMPRGATAGFGVLYTGFDLDNGDESSIFHVARNFSVKSALHWLLAQVGFQRAEAMGPLAAFGIKSAVILAKAAFVYGAGYWAIHHTVLRQKVEAGLKSGGLKTPRSVPWTVFAQSMTLLAQAPIVWPANLIEYVFDKIGVAENGTVRNLFNATFGYARRSNTRTPVDYTSLISGVVILGGEDSANVPIQNYFAVPFVAKMLAVVFPFLLPHVLAAWGVANASMAMYNLIQVLSNFVIYLTAGAYSYASSVQDVANNEALRVVADQMRAQGLDPNDPKNKAIFADGVNKAIRAQLSKQGLPDDRVFLFDATSIYQSIQNFVGYSAPQGKDSNQYYGVTRQGLMGRALDNALAAARADDKSGAVAVLQSAKKDFSLLSSFLANPKSFMSYQGVLSVAQSYRRVRTELVSFTYMGQASDAVDIPNSWAQRNSAGAQDAAQIFRNEYFKLLDLDKAQATKNTDDELRNFETKDGAFGRWQLCRAMTKANLEFIKETGQDPAVLYRDGIDQNTATLQTQYEGILQSKLLGTVGLYPDPQEAKFNADVKAKIDKDFDQRVATTPAISAYLNSLPPFERAKATQIFKSNLFAEEYVAETIQGERVPALSPAQPGRWQRFRQRQWVRNSPALTKTVRFGEALFSNSRYTRGFTPELLREIVPMLDQQISGNLRSLRYLPVYSTFNYLWNKDIWDIALPFKDYLISYAFRGLTIFGPSATMQQLSSNEGWKPGKSKAAMAKYALLYSWATAWGALFYGLFHDNMAHGLDMAIDVCKNLLQSL